MLMRRKSRLSDPRGRKKGEGEVGRGEVRADSAASPPPLSLLIGVGEVAGVRVLRE